MVILKNKNTSSGLCKSGFTIIEISIVLMMVSLITVGVIGGIKIIAIAQKEKFKREIRNFDLAKNDSLSEEIMIARKRTANSVVPQIAKPFIWLEATFAESYNDSQGTNGVSDGAITSWKNLVNDDNHFDVVAGTVSYIKRSIGNLPSIRFDGSSYLQSAGDYILKDKQTVFIVFSNIDISVSASDKNFYRHNNGGGQVAYIINGTNRFFIYNGSGVDGGVVPSVNPNILTYVYNSSSSFIRRNGSQIGAVGNAGTLNNQGVVNIGAGHSGGSKSKIDFGEMIFFDKVLTAEEIALVEEYLSNKWKISLI